MPQLFDAQLALNFVVNQAAYIEPQVYNMVYPAIQYQRLVPVDTSAPEFAQSVIYYSADKYGKADWINGNADDIPMVGSERSKYASQIHTAAVGYGFGWEEVRYAQMVGVNLAAEDAITARRAYEELVDGVALRGDAAKGLKGLVNQTGLTTTAAAAIWTGATDAQILSDLNNALMRSITGTNYTSRASTVLMSPERYLLLASRVFGTTQITLLDWLRQNNVYTAQTGQPLQIEAVMGLSTAGASANQRMVVYRNDPSVLKMHIPMPFRFLPAYQDGPMHWVVPGVFRLGGLDIRLTSEIQYVDGI